MTFENLKEIIGEHSKDTKLNLGSILKETGAPGLDQTQILGTALACAYSIGDGDLVSAIKEYAGEHLSVEEDQGAQTAAIMMGMNNIYYRFVHLVEDETYGTIPAKLRMTAIGNPGIEKVNFELYSLAISALSGCGMCINAHVDVLKKVGFSDEAIQSAVRIAAVINASAQTLKIRRLQ